MSQCLDNMTLRRAIEGRFSVRTFAPEPVTREAVQTLLSMAVRAPTAMHVEPWEFVVVQDVAMLKRISDKARDSMHAMMAEFHRTAANTTLIDQTEFDAFHGASTLIVICAPIAGRFAQADCWLAAQNLMLTAFGIGLGTCVIGMSLSALNLPEVKQELGIPSESQAVAPIIVGIPCGEVPAVERKPPHVLAWRSSEGIGSSQ